jgi:hypothetical protein
VQVASLTFTGAEGGDTGKGGTAVTALGGGLHGSAHAKGCHEVHTVSSVANSFGYSSRSGVSTLRLARRLSPRHQKRSQPTKAAQTAVTGLHQRRSSRLDHSPFYRFAQTAPSPTISANDNRRPYLRSAPNCPPQDQHRHHHPRATHSLPPNIPLACPFAVPFRAKLTASFLMW